MKLNCAVQTKRKSLALAKRLARIGMGDILLLVGAQGAAWWVWSVPTFDLQKLSTTL